jgi:hypothetical protein
MNKPVSPKKLLLDLLYEEKENGNYNKLLRLQHMIPLASYLDGLFWMK